jgi:hypothetical protein
MPGAAAQVPGQRLPDIGIAWHRPASARGRAQQVMRHPGAAALKAASAAEMAGSAARFMRTASQSTQMRRGARADRLPAPGRQAGGARERNP